MWGLAVGRKYPYFPVEKEHDQNTTTEKHKNCTVIAELITIKKEPESKRRNIIVEIFCQTSVLLYIIYVQSW